MNTFSRSNMSRSHRILDMLKDEWFIPKYETTNGTSFKEKMLAIDGYRIIYNSSSKVDVHPIATYTNISKNDDIASIEVNKENEIFTQQSSGSLDNHSLANNEIGYSSDLSEPFSPSSSEYIPDTSDADSEEDKFENIEEKVSRRVLRRKSVGKLSTSNRSSSPIINVISNILMCPAKLEESNQNGLALKEDIKSDNTLLHNQPKKRKWKKVIRQPDFCFFCETEVLNFARHVTRSHSGELEVQKIMSLPCKSLTRRNLISLLRKKGNHIRNVDTCVKPVKRSHVLDKTVNDYAPCKYCLGYYRPRQLWRHVKQCKSSNNSQTKYSHQSDAQDVLVKYLPIDSQLREIVFPRMKPDKISLMAKKDLLICKFGARYLKTHREKHLIHVCSRKMRELSKLLLEVQTLQPSIKNLYDALQPVYFDLFVEGTKKVAKYDIVREVFTSPTYAMNIQTSLKQCCDIAILLTLKRKYNNSTVTTAEAESNFKTFKQLLEDAWKFEISTVAAADLNMKKWNKLTILPLATDLKIFRNYLLKKADESIQHLKKNENSEKDYKLLMETIFCRLILLNRKRVGEMERMPLHVYSQTGVHQSYEEFSEAITPAEKILLTKFKRVVIRGKRGRGVPVLFSTDLQEHTGILITLRKNFVSDSNIYLFPKIGTNNPITGYKVIEKHAKISGVKNPSAITSTRLRKHLATLTQIFNMSSNDIEQLATFMGHTNDVHKQVYRLPDDVYQTAKISKLLMLMEKGEAGGYKGKTLDEIDLNIEDELIEEEEEISDAESNSPLVQVDPDIVPENGPSTSKRGRTLVPWTTDQKKIAKKFFANHITNKIPPKKGECEELKSSNPDIFDNKTWPQIKVFIQNIYRQS